MNFSSGAIQNSSGAGGRWGIPWLSENMPISCTDALMSLHTRSSAASGVKFHVPFSEESRQQPRPTPSVSSGTVDRAGASWTLDHS